jgi:hypothetical protein
MSPTLSDKGPEHQGWQGVVYKLIADTSRHGPISEVMVKHIG